MTAVLQDAIVSRDPEMVLFLLSSGVSVNKVFTDGRTPLNTAIVTGDDVTIAILLAADADIQQPDSFRVDCARLEPIHYAALYNHLELLQRFLSHGVCSDQPDEGNCTPLHHAATKGHIDVVLYLTEQGCDINWQSNSGRSPLWKAAQNGHRDLVQLLYTIGAQLDLQNKVGENVLFEVVRLDCLLPITKDLIELGIDIKTRDIEGNTVLHKACGLGKHSCMQCLIQAGVDISARNDYGNTALHNAAMHNYIKCVLYLLNSAPCDLINILNNVGHSALYVSMLHQQTDAASILHEFGARLKPKELRMFEKYESIRNKSKVLFWKWCLDLFSRPKTLASLCRVQIRNSLMSSVSDNVAALPIPVPLQRFLLSEE